MSELSGSAAIIDKILSPGSSRTRGPAPVTTNDANNSTGSGNTRETDTTAAYYGSSCSVSFGRGTRTREARSLKESISRRSLDASSLRDDERSALFLTESAEKCVESSRKWGATAGFPLGVGICYTVGYVDEQKSIVGGQINVFRFGTVADQEGALRLSQPPWAPSDDPTHLINPANPQLTASYGKTEMVLIGSFHLNLQVDPQTLKASRIRRHDDADRLSTLSPSGARVVSQDTPLLPSHFFDLSDRPAKRSPLAGTQPWGLFKRQAVASVSSNKDFSSDSACSDAGLSRNPFFSGDGTEAPPSAETPSSFVDSKQSTSPPIPPSPFVSAASRDVNVSFTLPSDFKQANSLLSVRSINFTEAAYELPGRYLMVLPVGLILYGALSSVAFFVVMAVTYERTRYRRGVWHHHKD
ncbi:hypothetical protein VP01_1776g8 [Puccinia sorghi]|uniref:Uncharacterized protein n=1 Tax=Puccinia sorghi TaxID=27349 RepID=A0A0L6VEU4_9BASI|nr:hypothetical protein VP01_1776g8 [Puccinia sorghi]